MVSKEEEGEEEAEEEEVKSGLFRDTWLEIGPELELEPEYKVIIHVQCAQEILLLYTL